MKCRFSWLPLEHNSWIKCTLDEDHLHFHEAGIYILEVGKESEVPHMLVDPWDS